MSTFAKSISHFGLVSAVALFTGLAVQPAQAQSANMTFFVTSNGPGKGADLGGLEGADLHSASNNLTKQTSLSEKGDVINGRGDTPNRHDALTGTQTDGTAFPA